MNGIRWSRSMGVVVAAVLVAAGCDARTEDAPGADPSVGGKADDASGADEAVATAVPVTRVATIEGLGLGLDEEFEWNLELQVDTLIDEVLDRGVIEFSVPPTTYDPRLAAFGMLLPEAAEGEATRFQVEVEHSDAGLTLDLVVDDERVTQLHPREHSRLRYTSGPDVACADLEALFPASFLEDALSAYDELGPLERCEVELASKGTEFVLSLVPAGVVLADAPPPREFDESEERFAADVVEAMDFLWFEGGGATTSLEGQRSACLGNALGADWSDLALHYYCQVELAPHRLCFTSAFLLLGKLDADASVDERVDEAFGACFDAEHRISEALERVPFVGEIESSREKLFGRDERTERRVELFRQIVARPAGTFEPQLEQAILERFYEGTQRPLRLLDARTDAGEWRWGAPQAYASSRYPLSE